MQQASPFEARGATSVTYDASHFFLKTRKERLGVFNESFECTPQKVASLNESFLVNTNTFKRFESLRWIKILTTSRRKVPALGPRRLSIIWTNGTCCVQREAGRPVLLVAWNRRALSLPNTSKTRSYKVTTSVYRLTQLKQTVDQKTGKQGSIYLFKLSVSGRITWMTDFITGKLWRFKSN